MFNREYSTGKWVVKLIIGSLVAGEDMKLFLKFNIANYFPVEYSLLNIENS